MMYVSVLHARIEKNCSKLILTIIQIACHLILLAVALKILRMLNITSLSVQIISLKEIHSFNLLDIFTRKIFIVLCSEKKF